MFVDLNGGSANRPRFLGELGKLSQSELILGESKYRRGAEIFGEAEPAEYLYQVIDGAVRSYKLLSDGRRQIGAFHLGGEFLASRTAGLTALRPRRSSTARCGWPSAAAWHMSPIRT